MRDGYYYPLSLAQLAEVGTMTKRQLQHLSDSDLLPDPDGVRQIKRAAIVGALVVGGFSLLAAGRLAAALPAETARYDGEIPDNLDGVARALHDKRPGVFADRLADPLYTYYLARTDRSILIPRRPLPGDLSIQIIDGREIFIDYRASKLRVLDSIDQRSFFGEIRGLSRGQDAEILGAWEQAEKPPEDIQKILDGAVSELRLNCSLAIRNGYERLLTAHPKIVERKVRP